MQDDILVDVCKSAKQIFQSETDFENTWIRYLEDADGLYWFHNSHWLVWDLNPKKIFQRSLRIFLKNQNFRLEILKIFSWIHHNAVEKWRHFDVFIIPILGYRYFQIKASNKAARFQSSSVAQYFYAIYQNFPNFKIFDFLSRLFRAVNIIDDEFEQITFH